MDRWFRYSRLHVLVMLPNCWSKMQLHSKLRK